MTLISDKKISGKIIQEDELVKIEQLPPQFFSFE